MTRTLNTIFRGVELLMAAFLAAMVILVFLNVVLRYFFDTGLVWSEEIARLCFIFLVYLGTVGAFRENRHLGAQTLVTSVPPLAQKVMYTVVQLIILWMMGVLIVGSVDLILLSIGDQWVATGFPRALVSAIGLVTGIAVAIIALANLFRLYFVKMSVPELIAVPPSDATSAALD